MANLGNIFDYREDPNRSNYDGSHGSGNGKTPIKKPPKPMIAYWLIALGIMLLVNSFLVPAVGKMSIIPASYNEFLTQIDKKNVDQVDLSDTAIEYTLKNSKTVYRTGRINYYDEVPRIYESGATFTQDIPSEVPTLLVLLINMLPMILLLWFGFRLSKKMGESMANGGGGGLFGMGNMGKANAKVY